MLRANGLAKVVDFGLAKLTQKRRPDSDSEAPTIARVDTDAGMVMGTVKYMSPEQARGLAVDARSDIFSLGAVIYEMISGRGPFEGATDADILVSILEKQPPPLTHDLPDAPSEPERIVRKCLEKERERRYQSARELLVDLKNLSSGRLFDQPAPKPSPSIAVLPFVNMSADPENEYFCDGLAEELINALTKIQNLRVAARTSAFSFKGKKLDVREIGQKLNVGTVLEGSVRKAGGRLRITAQFVKVADGYHLWSERYDRQVEDVFAIQDEISLAIVDALKVKLLGEERVALLKRNTDDTEAYQLYLKGRYCWNKRSEEGLKKGVEYFKQAIEKDPGYGLAYDGLADSYNILGFYSLLPPKEAFPKAELAALKALEIDNTLAEAHASLAYAMFYYDWDWPAAETEFRRAIELKPNYASAHQFYGNHLTAMGRWDEAIAEWKLAEELDPLSLIITAGIGWVYYFARRYDQAIEQLRKALELDSSFELMHLWLGWAYEQTAMFEEAIAEFQKAVALSGGRTGIVAALGHAYALSGRRDEAEKVLKRLTRLKQKYVSPYRIASLHAALGEMDQAFAWLEQAHKDRSHLLVFLKVDPKLDCLRSDPRFTDLLRRIGLPQ